MKRKILATICFVLMLISMMAFTGCGDSGSSSNTSGITGSGEEKDI